MNLHLCLLGMVVSYLFFIFQDCNFNMKKKNSSFALMMILRGLYFAMDAADVFSGTENLGEYVLLEIPTLLYIASCWCVVLFSSFFNMVFFFYSLRAILISILALVFFFFWRRKRMNSKTLWICVALLIVMIILALIVLILLFELIDSNGTEPVFTCNGRIIVEQAQFDNAYVLFHHI